MDPKQTHKLNQLRQQLDEGIARREALDRAIIELDLYRKRLERDGVLAYDASGRPSVIGSDLEHAIGILREISKGYAHQVDQLLDQLYDLAPMELFGYVRSQIERFMHMVEALK